MRNCATIEARNLAPYAAKASSSRGRAYPEKEHPYRSAFQRDRDRIIHSTAFRRLEYKTQVFVNHEGDYYRTRLTHTLEVAQIARTIARALGLNEDLVETIALAHDLGHTPFGHAGEEMLHDLMQAQGGFNHNVQTLRVVDFLEHKYPCFKGLNLTWEVREGIIKHATTYDVAEIPAQFQPDRQPTLEAQVVEMADEIAYDNHDLDDGLESGFIHESSLKKNVLWKKARQELRVSIKDKNIRKHQTIKNLINMEVTDLLATTRAKIKRHAVKTCEDARTRGERTVSFSRDIAALRAALKEFLKKNLYQHYRVVRMTNKAKRFVKELFEAYRADPEQLPRHFYARIRAEKNPERIICDYIAGMTDRYAQDEYKRLFSPYEHV